MQNTHLGGMQEVQGLWCSTANEGCPGKGEGQGHKAVGAEDHPRPQCPQDSG